jgi:hypothetical protein
LGASKAFFLKEWMKWNPLSDLDFLLFHEKKPLPVAGQGLSFIS